MHIAIVERNEALRRCGYRDKVGALYIMGEKPSAPCGKLPFPLDTFPACGGGIKPSRGWTWINIATLIEGVQCKVESACGNCVLRDPINHVIGRVIDGVPQWGECGLLWVGKMFYESPDVFCNEAAEMGISRRLAHVPKGLTFGKTWVALAHREAKWQVNEKGETTWSMGIFSFFKPTHMEVIVDGTESDEVIERYLERHLTPVKVNKTETVPMFDSHEIHAAMV